MILGRKYHIALPSFLANANTKHKCGATRGDDNEDDSGECRSVKNQNLQQRFKLCDGETYSQVFNPHLSSCPKWNGTGICVRYHVKGYCFSDCPRKSTHKDLPQAQGSAFAKWCQECCGE